jgi:hypothetical protein
MNGSKVSAPLVISLVLNIALAVLLVVTAKHARKSIDMALLESTEQSVRLQSEILDDLDSNDSARIEAAKAKLRTTIAIKSRVSYDARTSPGNKK